MLKSKKNNFHDIFSKKNGFFEINFVKTHLILKSKVMIKKIVVIAVLAILVILTTLILVTKKNNSKVQIEPKIITAEDTNVDELVFYNLERNSPPEQLINNQTESKLSIEPCSTDILCRIKNKNLENPYDTIINQSNDNISAASISEKDRLDAERFSESLILEPKSDQENEVLDMLDKLSNIQQGLDTHKNKVEHQSK